MTEDLKTAVKIFKLKAKGMSDEELEKEYEKLVKKYGKKAVDKELSLEEIKNVLTDFWTQVMLLNEQKIAVELIDEGKDKKGYWVMVAVKAEGYPERHYRYWLKSKEDVNTFKKYLKYTPGRALNFLKKVNISWERLLPLKITEQLNIKEIEEVKKELEEIIELLATKVVFPLSVWEEVAKRLSSTLKKAELYNFPFEFVRGLKDFYTKLLSIAKDVSELSGDVDDYISDFEDFLEESFKK